MFLVPVQARAEVMTKSELENAIAAARQLNQSTRAQRELESVHARLGQIAEKFPGTPAGQATEKLRSAMDQVLRLRSTKLGKPSSEIEFGENRYEPLPYDSFGTPDDSFTIPKAERVRSTGATDQTTNDADAPLFGE